jgi:pimeloyl-ACP methyl ester carboxylesterase
MIEIDDIEVSYDCDGKGDTVVLMHGWGGSILSFKPVFDYLSKNFRVYSFDFPGFGKSGVMQEAWGIEDYGNFIVRFFKKMNIDKTHIIGHSFGGRIAIWVAANFPEVVNKLVLVNSAGIRPKRTLKYYIKVAIAKAGKRVLLLSIFGGYGKKVLDYLYSLIGSKDYQQQAGAMRTTLVKVVNEDLRPLLSKITAPTLVVWGEEDKDVPLSLARIMEKEIKDAGLIVFKGAGHFSYLDRFSDFCVIVSNFFMNTGGSKSNV